MCCRQFIVNERWREADEVARSGNLALAELLFRARFVQYIHWVREHTIPVLRSPGTLRDWLVKTDVGALHELADAIVMIMLRRGRKDVVLAFIDGILPNVPLAQFKQRWHYLRAAWLYCMLDRREDALRELTQLGPIESWTDREALELYLDAGRDGISSRRAIEIADRIVKAADDNLAVKVQYLNMKAVSLNLVGEVDEARSVIAAAIAVAPIVPKAVSFEDAMLDFHLAGAFYTHAWLSDERASVESAKIAIEAIDLSPWGPDGQADFLRILGSIEMALGNFVAAATAYRSSSAIDPDPATRIGLAHALALSDGLAEAKGILQKIENEELHPNLRLEKLTAMGALAIATGSRALAGSVSQSLLSLDERQPFWAAQGNRIAAELAAFANGDTDLTATARQGKIVSVLRAINRNVELKPSYHGFGLNINAGIDWMLDKVSKVPDRQK
jgi:tetratricopeptide (TPR) repeat protein